MESTLKGTSNYLRNENGGTNKNSFSKFKPFSLFSRFSRKKEENTNTEDDNSTNVTGRNTSLRKLNETLRDILELLKTNIQEDKDRFGVERTFQEEKDRENEQKHQEFLTALQEFAQTRGFVIEEKKEEKSGLLDIFMKMFEKLKDALKAFGLRILKLSKFIFNTGRLLLRVFGWPALIIGGLYALLKFINKIMPDLTKIDYKEAQGMLVASDIEIEDYLKRHPNAIPEEYMKRNDLTGRQKIEAFINDQKKARLSELGGKQRAGTLTDAEKTELRDLELNPTAPAMAPPQLNSVPPRPATPANWNSPRPTADQIGWDNRFGRTHNPDGTPKGQTGAQPRNVAAPVASGRGGESQMVDYLARQEEERIRQSGTGGAAFGIYPSAGGRPVSSTMTPSSSTNSAVPMPMTPATPRTTPTPATGIQMPDSPSLYFNNIMRDNIELNLREMFSDVAEEAAPVINNNNSSKSNVGPFLGPEASQRDETHTFNVVVSRYRRMYV